MRKRGVVVVGVGAVLLAALVLWRLRPKAAVALRVEPAKSSAAPAPPAPTVPQPTPSAKRELYRRFQSEPALLASARRETDALRAQIERTLAARAESARAEPAPTPRPQSAQRDNDFPTLPAPSGSVTPEAAARRRAIQSTVKEEFIPLAVTCYQALLEKRPDAAGKLVLNMTIVGDRAIGGVVESAEIAPDSTLKDEELVTCIRESMLAVHFDPPPTDGGRVTLTYPFNFAP